MIDENNINEVRKQIQKLKREGKLVVVRAKDEDINRKIFEMKDVDMVIDLELHNRREGLKQRDSGLNEILCKLARKNEISIGINLGNVKKLDVREKGNAIGRIIQNINLCKRTKTKIVLLPEHSKQEILSFFSVLKGSTKQAKSAFKFK